MSATAFPEFEPRGAGAELTERLTRIVDGDDGARRWLHDTFAPRLSRRLRARYARFRGVDVEEVFQDTFLFFFQSAPRTFGRFLDEVPAAQRTETRLDAYLWDLACGIASNRLRSARRKPAASSMPVEEAVDPVDAERLTLDRDLLSKLKACLKRAGSRSYLYYKLRFVDGFTPDEIAVVTGWSRKITYKLRSVLDGAIDRCARRLGLR
ncbi:MAG TPA: sigma-70 family RNA polymerase sigma factor [Candidatus Polarisedimenticolaceae bacterium]|nr:sigma-70 family RNA polymerase sigma factor [Candidatus Polarisedimenticolaceae bacterium]